MLVVGALSLVLAVSLMGCGDVPTTTTTTKTTSTTTSKTTTTHSTTTTTSKHIKVPDSPCKEGKDAECAEMLNQRYMGFDENNASSPIGVTLRGRGGFEEAWYWCTGKCHGGQPDCYTAGSLVNHKIMLTKEHTLKPMMNMGIYVIIQPFAADHVVTKCAYQYDGAASKKLNGGCSQGAPDGGSCDLKKDSAFTNLCPEDRSKHANADDCPSVLEKWCGQKEVNYPDTCSWKGPAWSSPTYGGAKANISKLDTENELHKMVKQRLKTQTKDGPTTMCGKQTCTEYWTEMTMDGRLIDALMNQHPSDVIAAFAYDKGNKAHQILANLYNEQLYRDKNAKVPIISIDMNVNVEKQGPFGIAEGSTAVV